MQIDKPNCYECKYRGTIPGNAHSCCNHPELGGKSDNQFSAMAATMTGKYLAAEAKLNVVGDPHGIKSGWFCWPANFDPVWLLACNGFEAKIKKEKENE